MKSLQKNRIANIYAIAVVFLILSAVLEISLGSTVLNIFDTIKMIANGNTDNPEARILIYVRFPRTVATIVCGMAFAVSGAVIQSVLANRLASPSVIGVNAGAGLAVTICSAFGIVGGIRLSLFSFVGAFFTVIIISSGAKKWGRDKGTVVLMGVAVNAFLGAVSDSVTTLIPEVSVMSNDFKIGDFSSVTYVKVIPAGFIVLISFVILLTLCNALDVLSLGDENSKALGLNSEIIRIVFLLLSALLAGAAVSVCGLLSFVGLLVPHAVRRLASSVSAHLIPLSALFGAGFVTICDVFARIIFAPYELPVGIIMAFLGAPFFIFILVKRNGGQQHD